MESIENRQSHAATGGELYRHLAFLYGGESARRAWQVLLEHLERFRQSHPHLGARPEGRLERFNERDVVLITYGDMIQAPGEAPLHTLAQFLEDHLSDALSTVHILPFYPYSSDDGFSVIDYQAVEPALGTWEDVHHIGRRFRLMFDAVVNHISAESAWFQAFLHDEPPYRDYFIVVAPDTDLSQVFRPRALPLLTPVHTVTGRKQVWTTFSADQIDLNYANPAVLLTVIDLLLFYVANGADFIRLDAIAYLWKEAGTSCIHLPQTHHIIQLMRAVLDVVAPRVALITETNVPHQDNIAYFGNGYNEAQMVYNFSLPPLILHAFHTGSAEALSRWAEGLSLPSDEVTFFNFLASHDGIGVTPARGILPEPVIDAMIERVQALGGYVSYKNNPDGSQSAYELNINYLDALGDPEAPEEAMETVAARFLAAQAIMLALRGVPGIYFHSLLGSRSWREGVRESGRYRTINRQKLQRPRLEAELAAAGSLRRRIFGGYLALLQARRASAAFHPNGAQHILFCHESVFAVWRTSPDGRRHIFCLHNVSGRTHRLELSRAGLPWAGPGGFVDLLSGRRYATGEAVTVEIGPYEVLWLKPDATQA